MNSNPIWNPFDWLLCYIWGYETQYFIHIFTQFCSIVGQHNFEKVWSQFFEFYVIWVVEMHVHMFVGHKENEKILDYMKIKHINT